LNSLPSLSQGECWVWLQGSHQPVRIKVPEKKTIHPDRRNPLVIKSGVTADVSGFVRKLNDVLNREAAQKLMPIPTKTYKQPKITAELLTNNEVFDNMEYQIKIDELTEENNSLKQKLATETSLRKDVENKLETVRAMLKPQYDSLVKIFKQVDVVESNGVDVSKYKIWLDKFEAKHKTMLELIIEHKKLDRRKWCLLAGINYTSDWFDKGFRKMKQLGLVEKQGNEFVLRNI
jgi:hypothetical protein